MTGPTQSEVEAIIARLTRAQRDALISHRVPSQPSNPICRTHYALMGGHQRVCHGLVKAGLMDIFSDSYGDRHSGVRMEHRFACTTLGLAVRTHLQRAAALSKLAALDAETMDKENGHG